MVYSRALAQWYVEEDAIEEKKQKKESKQDKKEQSNNPSRQLYHECVSPPSSSPSSSSSSPSPSSSRLIQEAILLYPEVLAPLVTECNENVAKTPRWKRVFAALSSLYESNPFIDRLVYIYIQRSAILFKPQAVMDWLQTHGELLVNKVESKACDTRGMAELRRSLFAQRPLPDNLKNLQKSDYSDYVATLPEEMRRPLARRQQQDQHEAEDIFPLFAQLQQQQQADHAQVNGDNVIYLDGANPLVVFLRSLLPWMTIEPNHDQNHDQ